MLQEKLKKIKENFILKKDEDNKKKIENFNYYSNYNKYNMEQ